MASPGEFEGKRRGSCGHVTAAFHLHEKCARCHEKKVGDDPCIKGQKCVVCEWFSDTQCEILPTPSYKICKEKRAGTLVSPKDMTVISSLDLEEQASSESTCSIYFFTAGFLCNLCPI